jgi:hypothetical protein
MIVRYQPVLSVNDVFVPLTRFSYSAPANTLGSRADAVISDISIPISRGDDFDLLIKIPSGTQPKKKLINNGKVVATGRETASVRAGGLSLPNDSLSVVGIDNIGERWKLAPRVPVILYDPAFVTLQSNETDSNVNDEDGDRIFATTTAVPSLDLEYVLNYAYVDRCGFSEVITNIPNYRIPRADFSLNSSFHTIASSFYSIFNPIKFEDEDRLFIIDVFGEIPEGILSAARNVSVSKYISSSVQKPEIAVVNAVLLTHKQPTPQLNGVDEFPSNVTDRIDSESQDIGQPGAKGWINNQFKRYVKEFHEDEDDLAKITGEIVWKVETITTGKDESNVTRTLLQEAQTDRYSNSWRLKLGYSKTTDAYTEDGDGGKLLQNVQTETNIIIWQPSIKNPGEYEKLYSQTQIEGLIHVDGNFALDGDGFPIFETDTIAVPLLEASNNKEVPNDSSTSVMRGPISTTNETWRYTGTDQIEVHTQKINHLSGRVEVSPRTTEHIGTNAARVRNGEAFNTKQVLLTDPTSDLADGAREPISFDAGYVSYPIAKELALRALAEARNPRETVKVELARFDGGIRRGSIRNLVDRDGNVKTVIITGFQIEGLPIRQTIEGVVIA